MKKSQTANILFSGPIRNLLSFLSLSVGPTIGQAAEIFASYFLFFAILLF